MAKKKVILIGGGGHCKMVISQLRRLDEFEIVGIVDNHKPLGSLVMGIKVVGGDEDVKNLYRKGVRFALITVGSVKDNMKRWKLFNMAKEVGYESPVIISPTATIDESVKIDEGTVIMPRCVVNVDSFIGKNCIINTGAIIEHDCKIEDHCHIAPGVHLSGGVKIGDLSFIGIGSIVVQGTKIGKNATVGAGSVVTSDVPDNTVVIGNPARIIKTKKDE